MEAIMKINLLGGELLVDISFENSDREFDDNICLCIQEPCLEDTKLFRAKVTNIFITAQEARLLANLLLNAAEASDLASQDAINKDRLE
jgi:hypothetical protein